MSLHTLDALGFGPFFREQLAELDGEHAGHVPMRVAVEYQDRHQLIGEAGMAWGQLSGNLRHDSTEDRLRRPAVGDWVLVRPGDGEDVGTITHLFRRRTVFARQAAGRRAGAQVIAANIDTVFIVTSCNRDFNLRRLERYLATVAESGAGAVVVLNKADLCPQPQEYLYELGVIAPGTPVVLTSARAGQGMDSDGLRKYIEPGHTVALVGSSGVGKSTIVNWLAGRDMQAVGEIRADDDRGRHTTTHRELIAMPGGGILIDTPGMRELRLWSSTEGLHEAFSDIEELAQSCKFRDCSHAAEPGCALHAAVTAGQLDYARFGSYLKLKREQVEQEARTTMGGERYQRSRGQKVAKYRKQVKHLKPGSGE